MAMPDFGYFYFDPKIQNFFFPKITAYKTQMFPFIQKNGIYVIEIHTNNTHTKFQNNIFAFDCAMAKKTGDGDDVTFLKCSFWHL